MWLVVCKHEYYPSVFEFDDKSKAEDKYAMLKLYINDLYGEIDQIEDHKIYMCEINKSHGDNHKDVSWYL